MTDLEQFVAMLGKRRVMHELTAYEPGGIEGGTVRIDLHTYPTVVVWFEAGAFNGIGTQQEGSNITIDAWTVSDEEGTGI